MTTTLTGMEGSLFNPWRHAGQFRDLIVEFTDDVPLVCGDGCWIPVDGGGVIAIRPGLPQIPRRCVMAHETIHHERNGGCTPPEQMPIPELWRAVNAREEQRVDDEAIRRLVPMHELLRLVVELEAGCEHAQPHHVIERFHVTDAYATRALKLLDRHLNEIVAHHYDQKTEP